MSTTTLGEKLRSNEERARRIKKPWPMPPDVSTGSYAESCFSKINISPESVQAVKSAFKRLWSNLSFQIRKGALEPSYTVLDGPTVTGHQKCLAAAMFQNHEVWQQFVKKCKDNNLAIAISDHTDKEGFDVELHFRTTLD